MECNNYAISISFVLTTVDIEGVGGVGGAEVGGEDVGGALSNNSAFGSIDMILFILLLAFSGLPK